MDELRLPKLNPELVVVVPVPKLKLGAVDAAVPKEKPVLPNPVSSSVWNCPTTASGKLAVKHFHLLVLKFFI